MKFGYTIIYVTSVKETLEFYGKAFGFATKFLHESEEYGELDTGETILAFASCNLANEHFQGVYTPVSLFEKPVGIELGFVTDDVDGAFNQAIDAGALILKMPETKPWGQRVAYVRTPEGTLIELCSPVVS